MKPMVVCSLVLSAVVLAPAARLHAGADVVRTVYFSAVDGKGTPVTDLTAADLSVKEGGKDRPVRDVGPATAPMQVFFLIDDAGSGAFQGAVGQFLEATLGHGQFTISALNPQPIKVADFTEDVAALKAGLARIGPRGKVSTVGEQIIEAVSEAAKELQQRKAARPVIIVLTAGGEQAQSDQADHALTSLKSSGASLNVVYVTGLELGKVLGDGPKQSGGLTQHVAGNVTPGPVLTALADRLLHQYALTYVIPDGVKLSDRLALTTSRKGVTLVAPSRLPDK